MSISKGSLAFGALALLMLSSFYRESAGFLFPIGQCTPTSRRTRSTASDQFRTRPEFVRSGRTRQAMMSSHIPLGASPTGDMEGRAHVSRFSRISQGVKRIFRKAFPGYRSRKDDVEQAVTASGAASVNVKLMDARLTRDAVKARYAAEQAVAASNADASVADHHDPLSEVVRLDIGNTSPMDADAVASLRKRLEAGISTGSAAVDDDAIAAAAALKRRQAQARARQQRKDRLTRPASFDGDTAVAEMPSPAGENRRPNRQEPSKSKPKMAAQTDIERLNRLFGSVGREPLP